MVRAWSLAVPGMVLLGCGSGPVAQMATRTDSAGVEIVTNTAEDRPLGWGFERVLSLGGADAGPESFYRVPQDGVAFDEAGRIYVLDAGNRHVHVFDEAGDHVRTMGREGRGPGEFQYPTSVVVEPSGTVAVHDFGRRAAIRFDSTGTFLDQKPSARVVSGLVRTDGSARVFATRRRDPNGGGVFFRLYRATAKDTAALAELRRPGAKSIRYEACRVRVSMPPLFANPPSWDARGGRVALGGVPEYSIRIFESGTEVRHVRRPIEPEAATVDHAARELGEGEEWMIGDRSCTVPLEEVIEKRGIADGVPAIARVAVTPEGGVWVQREVVGEDVGPVDVFDATGEYVGTLPPETPWPADFGPGDRILAVEQDALDIQRVVVYRIRRD